MIGQAGLPTELQASLNVVKKFIKSNFDEPVMLGVFDNEEDAMFKLFIEANNEIRDEYRFGHTFDPAVKKFFKLDQSAIMVIQPEHLVSKYEKRYQIYKVRRSIFFFIQTTSSVSEISLNVCFLLKPGLRDFEIF